MRNGVVSAESVSTDAWTAASCRAFRALFSTCGAAGAEAAVDAPELALVLTSLSGQFAWHAELLVDLLVTSTGTDVDARVAQPAPGTDEALHVLDELRAHKEWSSICVVLARVVVPRLRTGVAEALARVDARVDGPRARALTLVARDLADACERLEPLAERALEVPGAIDTTSTRCAEVERALVAGGVASGLVATARSARRG